MKNQTVLIHGNTYNLGAVDAIYNAHTDSFQGGNWSVSRDETIFKNAIGATVKNYKLVRGDGRAVFFRDGLKPIVWGKVDYRLYEYMKLGDTYDWVQIDGMF